MIFRLISMAAFGAQVAIAISGSVSAQTLPELTVDNTATTVSGLSSGAYMAVQVHVAFSESIAGAGVVAGGPYFCAQGNVLTALTQCMQTLPGGPNDAALLQLAENFASNGEIDPLTGLAGDRVYLFTGTQDNTVTRPAVDAAEDFYLAAGIASGDIRYVTNVPAGHAFLADDAPNSCGVTQPDFINDCDVDQAGDILTWLYGPLDPPVVPLPGNMVEFDQSAFLPNPEAHGMDERGFAYVPVDCAAGATCRLHIAFHGCEQTPDQIGDLYARTTGYNRWAEANDIVVLYPQAQIIPSPPTDPLGGNPKGCWDWWGYDDADYAEQDGRQMAAVAAMAGRLGAPFSAASGPDPDGGDEFCVRHAATNWQHFLNDRARQCGFFAVCAVGSGDVIGTFFGMSVLFENPQGTFSTETCEG